MNFNVDAPEFVPKWKLPSVKPDQDTTGWPSKEKKLEKEDPRPLVSKGPLEKSNKKRVKKNCEFCKKKGQRLAIYSSHQMQDSKTKEILCPMLKETM